MTKGSLNKSGRGGHGRPLSQKTLNMQKKNQFAALEGVAEVSVQKMISEYTVSKTNKKRPLSPEKTDNCRAKKLNCEGNPNLIPLGNRPTSSSVNLMGEFTTEAQISPVITGVSKEDMAPTLTQDQSYASITSGAPTKSSSAILSNGMSGPKEASASALAFEPITTQLCDALSNNKVDGLSQVFGLLVNFIEASTKTIDSQSEKIEQLSSLVTKQSDEIHFLRSKLADLENGVKSGCDNPNFNRLRSEKSLVKEQFENANKTVRVVNIEKKGRSHRNIISDTLEALGANRTSKLSTDEANCFSHSDNELCTVTLKCRTVEEKNILENNGRAKGLATRNHVPRNFVRTLKELREAYLCSDFKGAIDKNDRLIMIRTNQSLSGLQVHMKSKRESTGWRVIEYINFPTSLQCIKSMDGKQTMKSSLIDLSNIFIPHNVRE